MVRIQFNHAWQAIKYFEEGGVLYVKFNLINFTDFDRWEASGFSRIMSIKEFRGANPYKITLPK